MYIRRMIPVQVWKAICQSQQFQSQTEVGGIRRFELWHYHIVSFFTYVQLHVMLYVYLFSVYNHKAIHVGPA